MNSYRLLKTASGYAGFVISPRGLRRVYLPEKSAEQLRRLILKESPDASENRALWPEFADELKRYFAGQRVVFKPKLDVESHSDFYADVYRACRAIPYGQTRTYKQLAEKVGRPAAARAVGGAMRRNPCPIVTPCHRVLRRDGALGGFSAPGGLKTKRRLLDMEAARVAKTY